MGARSTYTFTWDDRPEAGHRDCAHIYLHWGGEDAPEVEDTIRAFFAALDGVKDKRGGDPSYLAAKFVVWASQARTWSSGPTLDFLGVGVMYERMDGADYGAVFCCGDVDSNGLPAAYTSPDTMSTDRQDFDPFPG